MQITLKVRQKNLKHFRIGRQMDFNIEGMHGTARVSRIDTKPIDVTCANARFEKFVMSEWSTVTLQVDAFVDQPLGGVQPGDVVSQDGYGNVYVNGLRLYREAEKLHPNYHCTLDPALTRITEGYLSKAIDAAMPQLKDDLGKRMKESLQLFLVHRFLRELLRNTS